MNSGCTFRAARESDLRAALVSVRENFQGSRGMDRTLELVEDAVLGRSGEYRAFVAERGDECAGVGIYGLVSGTVGTAALYLLVVVEQETTGRGILDRILADLTSSGTRLVVAEFPGDASPDYRSLLESAGFIEESRVADYYEDGVPLVQHRMELRAAELARALLS